MKDLICQCFVQFRCQLVKEKLIDQEEIFIDGTKIEANAKINLRLSGRNRLKSITMLEKEIIPEIERNTVYSFLPSDIATISLTSWLVLLLH